MQIKLALQNVGTAKSSIDQCGKIQSSYRFLSLGQLLPFFSNKF